MSDYSSQLSNYFSETGVLLQNEVVHNVIGLYTKQLETKRGLHYQICALSDNGKQYTFLAPTEDDMDDFYIVNYHDLKVVASCPDLHRRKK